jgi:hypothetical protein
MPFVVDDLPALPVAAVALPPERLALRPLREREPNDLADDALARLVRARIALEQTHGWAVFACFVVAVLSVFLFGGSVESRAVLGVYAAAVASAAAGLGFFVERLSWRVFLQLGRRQGLSDRACALIFERAQGADRWIDMMKACGREPTDDELARFITSASRCTPRA